MWFVIAGNPLNGLSSYGPFTDSDFAVDWAEVYISDSDWWISEITPVDEYEET